MLSSDPLPTRPQGYLPDTQLDMDDCTGNLGYTHLRTQNLLDSLPIWTRESKACITGPVTA